ncbi:MAG: folate family ECF transporter S component [Ruminococcaceae bacterium]|nr:folate family ECF transporter S component [Oscillospiraceae bacterium]
MLKKRKRATENIKSMTIAAMLTAMSVVIGILCKNFLNFGGGLFRVTFENLPIIMGGLLFGPVIGGIIGAASDLLSYLFSAQIYPPNLIVTVGAISVGVVSGVMSKYVVRKKGKGQIIISGGLAHIVGSMIIKPIGLFQFYSWAVLFRIPLYFVIAPLEIILICVLFSRKSFSRIVGYTNSDKEKI